MVPSQWATPLRFVVLAGFGALEGLGGQQLLRQPITQWTPPCYSPHDYIVGALVALSIAALSKVTPTTPGIALERLIRGLAGASFGLYLLHYPLLNFFGTVILGPPDRAMHGCSCSPFLGCSIALAHLIEQREAVLKRAFRSAHVLIQRKLSRAAFDRTEALSRPALRMQTALLIPSLRG